MCAHLEGGGSRYTAEVLITHVLGNFSMFLGFHKHVG